MSMTADLRDRIKADAEISQVAAGRVYRDERPQGDPLPAIVLFLISDPRPSVFGGEQSLRRTRVQLDCLANSRGLSDLLAERAIAATKDSVVVGGTAFIRAFVANSRSDSRRDGDTTTFRTIVDLMVWHAAA